jgi:transcriptional regulator with XRE-family HTH domain
MVDGPRIRELREEAGLSVRTFAQRVGRHDSTIRRVETDEEKAVSRLLAAQLARGLGVDLSAITRKADDPSQQSRPVANQIAS